MRRTAILSAALLALVLAGCGGKEDATAPQVAALPSASASTGTATGGSGTGSKGSTAGQPVSNARPQMRLDDTDERRQDLISAWDECLVKHGARYAPSRGPGVSAGPAGKGPGARVVAEPIPAKAKAACMDKLPLMPPELEPDSNPHYRDDWLANVKCLRAHGYKVHLANDTSAGPNGLTWTYDEDAGELPDNATKIENDCQMVAFGNKK